MSQTALQPKLRLSAPWLALGLAVLLAWPAWAGYRGAIGGRGFQVGGVTPAGPLAPNAQAFVNEVGAQLGLPAAAARARALIIQQNVCCAIELVKKRNAAIGACLAKLKKAGQLCVSWTMRGGTCGTAVSDGKPDCKGDRINLNMAFINTMVKVPSYDPNMYWLATTLLHEGKHASQDYRAGEGQPAVRRTAERQKKRACNEIEAYQAELDWIAELEAAMAQLLAFPGLPANPAWDAATKQIYTELQALAPAARLTAIAKLGKAYQANKRSCAVAIACYTKTKQAYQTFIDGWPYVDNAALETARETLRRALARAKWRAFVTNYELPKQLVHSAESGQIFQYEDEQEFILQTPLQAIFDSQELQQGQALLVSGEAQPGAGSLLLYVDGNGNGFFEEFEGQFLVQDDPQLVSNLDLVPDPIGGRVLLYEMENEVLFELLDLDFDGLPDQLGPAVFQAQMDLETPLEWVWDVEAQELIGIDVVDSVQPSFAAFHERVVLVDPDGDGFLELGGQVDVLGVVQFPPAIDEGLLAGQSMLEFGAMLGLQVEAWVVDDLFQPVELLGAGVSQQIAGQPMPLSRSLQAGETVMLLAPGAGQVSAARTVELPPFESYCFGEACPCGNNDPAAGCANSTGGGGLLTPSGSNSLTADDLQFSLDGLVPGQFGVLFTGTTAIQLPFGDGQRCVGGEVLRFEVTQANARGSFFVGPGLAGRVGLSPGDSRTFQGWYRDPGGPCGSGFNLTNAVQVNFAE